MTSDFLTALQREISDLEAELANDPRYEKLRHLKELSALYSGSPQSLASGAARQSQRSAKAASEALDQALDLAEELIKGRTEPTPTAEILHWVESRGVVIDGKNPLANLSAKLSRSPHFKANGRSGWTLEAKTTLDGGGDQQSEARSDTQRTGVDVGGTTQDFEEVSGENHKARDSAYMSDWLPHEGPNSEPAD